MLYSVYWFIRPPPPLSGPTTIFFCVCSLTQRMFRGKCVTIFLTQSSFYFRLRNITDKPLATTCQFQGQQQYKTNLQGYIFTTSNFLSPPTLFQMIFFSPKYRIDWGEIFFIPVEYKIWSWNSSLIDFLSFFPLSPLFLKFPFTIFYKIRGGRKTRVKGIGVGVAWGGGLGKKISRNCKRQTFWWTYTDGRKNDLCMC